MKWDSWSGRWFPSVLLLTLALSGGSEEERTGDEEGPDWWALKTALHRPEEAAGRRALHDLADREAIPPLLLPQVAVIIGDPSRGFEGHGDTRARLTAIEVAPRFGERSELLVPYLAANLGDPMCGGKVAKTLGEIGGTAVEPLVAALEHEESIVRRRAVEGLRLVGEGQLPAAIAPRLIALIGSSTVAMDRDLGSLLGRIAGHGEGDVEAIDWIVGALEGSSGRELLVACAAAPGLAPRFGDPVPLLADIATDTGTRNYVRATALRSLGLIRDFDSPEVRDAIAEGFGAKAATVRVAAAEASAYLLSEDEDLKNAIVAMGRGDEDARVRRAAGRALASAGEWDPRFFAADEDGALAYQAPPDLTEELVEQIVETARAPVRELGRLEAAVGGKAVRLQRIMVARRKMEKDLVADMEKVADATLDYSHWRRHERQVLFPFVGNVVVAENHKADGSGYKELRRRAAAFVRNQNRYRNHLENLVRDMSQNSSLDDRSNEIVANLERNYAMGLYEDEIYRILILRLANLDEGHIRLQNLQSEEYREMDSVDQELMDFRRRINARANR